MYMAIFTHTFCPIAPTKNSNKKGHFPHEIHAKNVLFTYSHQPDSLEMYFSNQPDNLYYHSMYMAIFTHTFCPIAQIIYIIKFRLDSPPRIVII